MGIILSQYKDPSLKITHLTGLVHAAFMLLVHAIFLQPKNGCFQKSWGENPPNHRFVHRVFHDFHHPFWGKHPYFWFNTQLLRVSLASNQTHMLGGNPRFPSCGSAAWGWEILNWWVVVPGYPGTTKNCTSFFSIHFFFIMKGHFIFHFGWNSCSFLFFLVDFFGRISQVSLVLYIAYGHFFWVFGTQLFRCRVLNLAVSNITHFRFYLEKLFGAIAGLVVIHSGNLT